jgi:hypothetical protein
VIPQFFRSCLLHQALSLTELIVSFTGKAVCHEAFPNGMYFPVYGAPAASANTFRAVTAFTLTGVFLAVIAALLS